MKLGSLKEGERPAKDGWAGAQHHGWLTEFEEGR